MLNDSVRNNLEGLEEDYGDKLPEQYLKNYLICNLIAAIISPVVHLWQLFFWFMKTVVFGAIDLISDVVKDFKGKK